MEETPSSQKKGLGFAGTRSENLHQLTWLRQGNRRLFEKLRKGGTIGIFPEGGSHDRTQLLPLKAGISIMALGACAKHPGLGVVIVPVGLNYFSGHRFRSRP